MLGELWGTIPLERLLEPGRGISYGIVQPGPPVHDGVPIIRVGDIRNGRISTSEPLRVAPEIESTYARTRLRGGELLLTLVGTVGETAIVPESLAGWNTARAVAVIPIKREIGAYWVALALKGQTLRHVIDSRLNTTVQATLNLKDVAQLPVALPPVEVRQRIVELIGAIDNKIELNRRMNETLEAIARTIFKSWFVDFDSGSEAPDTEPFESIAVTSRESVNPREHSNESFDHYSIPAFDERHLPVIEAGENIKSNKFLVREDSVLLSKLNPRIPRVWMPTLNKTRRAICSTEFLVLRPRGTSSREYLYGLCTSQSFLEVFATMVTGTSGSHQRVKPQYLEQMPVVKGDKQLIERYTQIVKPLHARLAHNLRESDTLAALRDTLLPKLMSGEIRIKDTQKIVEANA